MKAEPHLRVIGKKGIFLSSPFGAIDNYQLSAAFQNSFRNCLRLTELMSS